jgi:hypothetical protein
LLVFFVGSFFISNAQDNSPYSRYGLGNLMPLTNSAGRGLGQLSAAYTDYTGVNFVNPASYSSFVSAKEARSNKLQSGRAILDVGINFTTRSLIEPNNPVKSTSSDLLFSYLQVGVPLKKNWGLSFGIRPVSRIGYFIDKREMLTDPITGANIDSAVTQYKGSGGTYLPTVGTGVGFTLSRDTSGGKIKRSSVSLGVNVGYFFGNRETKTLLNLLNDSVQSYASEHVVNTSFGDLFLNAGLLYEYETRNLARNKTSFFRFGVAGNINQDINAEQDKLVQTYALGLSGEELQIDSVFEQKGTKGKVIYPGSIKAGFVYQKIDNKYFNGWMIGMDFTTTKWSDYRFYGQQDSVRDNWQVSVGASFTSKPRKSYLSNVVYRFGFYTGPDYIKVQDDMPQFGVTVGFGLPLFNFNRQTYQSTLVNLAFDYGKRGNNDNVLKENLFRLTVGFNFNDLWFQKRKYD